MIEGSANIAVASALKSTAVALCSRIEHITDEIAREIQRSLPELADHAGLVAETRAAAHATLTQFFAMLREDVDPERAQLTPEMTRLTREFVHRGVDLTGLLHTLRIGHAVIWKAWLQALRAECNDPAVLGDALGVASQLQFAYVNALSSHAADEFRVEREHWSRSADAVRVEVLNAVLAQEDIDVAIAGSRLGHELRREHLGLAIWTDEGAKDGAIDALRRVTHEIATAVECPRPLLIPMGELLLAGWIAGTRAPTAEAVEAVALARLGSPALRMSIGTVGQDLAGFRRTHQEAMWARGVAIRATATRGPVVRYDTVALASIALADFEQASNFVIRELGPLARKEEETQRLASTLMVYLEEGSSLDRAARRLGVHKNTVLNRVKRARELMGRGLDERNLELQVALAFARYLGDQ